MQVIKLNGDHLTFKGRVYGSVGIEYRIEYDKTAFQVEYNCEYVYSKGIMCDKNVSPCTLSCQLIPNGKYTILNTYSTYIH